MLLLLFGINKIADLQVYLLGGLKTLAIELGLRQYRGPLHSVFLVTVGLLGIGIAALGWRHVRAASAGRPWLPLGIACLLGYYLLRAAGSVSGRFGFFSPQNLWPLEVAGCLFVLFAAARRGQTTEDAESTELMPTKN